MRTHPSASGQNEELILLGREEREQRVLFCEKKSVFVFVDGVVRVRENKEEKKRKDNKEGQRKRGRRVQP